MERIFGSTADPEEIGRLIKKTDDLIGPTISDFLSDVLEQCKKEFKENFPTLRNAL